MSKFLRWKWGITASAVILCVILLIVLRRPSRPEDHYRRALQAVESGNLQAVRQELSWFRRTPGTEGYRSLLVGIVLVKEGDAAAALGELQHAANSNTTRVAAWTYAAEAFYQLGRFTDAAAVASLALEADPQSHLARRWLASAYYDLGAISPAADELRVLSRELPTDGRPDRLLGLINKDNEQFADAVKHYRESLRRDPRPNDVNDVLTELAECQLKSQDQTGALETLSHVPATPATLLLQAEAYEGLGRQAEAHHAVDQALELEPEHVPSLVYKATLLMTGKNPREAVSELEKALQLHPHDATARFKLSQAFNQLGDVERAAEQARLTEESRKLEREFVDLHRQVAADTKNAELRFRLGTLARELHKPELARMWFRAAVALDPNYTAARKALAE